jgi:hypothetical protein
MNPSATHDPERQDVRHQCLIYEGSPATHLPALAAMIGHKLQSNHRCLYLNSAPMVSGIRSYLYASGVDVSMEMRKGSLFFSSDHGHLKHGEFDIDHMLNLLEKAVSQALADGYEGLWATGDMSWEFGSQRNFSRLLEYERRLDSFLQDNPAISGVCQYQVDTLPPEVVQQGLVSHRSMFIDERSSRLNPHYIPPSDLINTG